jgi:hypothetical protein
MAKLTYWVAAIKDDSPVYSLRAKTRKAVQAMLDETGEADNYDAPRKVEVEYADAFDLMDQCLSGETRLWEEPR